MTLKKPTSGQIKAEHERLHAPLPNPFVDHLKGLRAYYDPANPIGLLLDEIAKDTVAGKPRKKTVTKAQAMLPSLDPQSTAYKAVQRFLVIPA